LSSRERTRGLVFGLAHCRAIGLARRVLLQHVEVAPIVPRPEQLPSACGNSRNLAVAVLGMGVSLGGGGSVSLQEDLAAIETIRRDSGNCQFILLTASQVSLSQCCQAVRAGVLAIASVSDESFEQQLDRFVYQAVEQYDALSHASRQLHQKNLLDQTGIASQSRSMASLLLQARKAAAVSDAPIIIEGESGTGKQLLAEAIHKMDPKRRRKPFLSVNCAAISGTLAESALFGHRKGAFTGATEDRLGYFRAADGGTLLLDEISELQRSLQPKLLRVLQENKVMPVGDDREYDCNVRVIAASNKPLAQEVANGRFRLDLYQRLNVIHLHIPPLRQRLEDIPLLFACFLEKYAHYYDKPIRWVDPQVYQVLGKAIGDGNVRELENIVRQILIMKSTGQQITLADLPASVLEAGSGRCDVARSIPADLAEHISGMIQAGKVSLPQLIADYERLILATAMNRLGLRGTRLADRLGVTRRTLYNKLNRHGLQTQDQPASR